MTYIFKRTEEDAKGKSKDRYFCPVCLGTVGSGPVGSNIYVREICVNCGTKLLLNPEEVVREGKETS